MDIIKERFKNTGIIRTNTYAHSLSHFEMMYKEALKDFPTLNSEDISVCHYGGIRYKGTYGLEFLIPDGEQSPESYRERETVEFIL